MPDPSDVIAAAREKMPWVRMFRLTPPIEEWSEAGYTKTNWKLSWGGPPDCDGDSPMSCTHAPTLAALLEKVRGK